jgi:hypothetical protein
VSLGRPSAFPLATTHHHNSHLTSTRSSGASKSTTAGQAILSSAQLATQQAWLDHVGARLFGERGPTQRRAEQLLQRDTIIAGPPWPCTTLRWAEATIKLRAALIPSCIAGRAPHQVSSARFTKAQLRASWHTSVVAGLAARQPRHLTSPRNVSHYSSTGPKLRCTVADTTQLKLMHRLQHNQTTTLSMLRLVCWGPGAALVVPSTTYNSSLNHVLIVPGPVLNIMSVHAFEAYESLSQGCA